MQAAKWVILVVSACILIYLGMRHIGSIAGAISNLASLVQPLLVGLVMALILNVPMSFFEEKLLGKTKLKKAKRPLAIALSLVLVIGIFVGIAVLVVPELVKAVQLIIQIITGGLDQLAEINDASVDAKTAENFFAKIEINWLAIKLQLENWIKEQQDSMLNFVVGLAGSAVSGIVTGFIGLVFAIYTLAQKDNLKRQACRLIHAWLPERFGKTIIHITDVYGKTFKLFIAGQATEAIILGVLCMIGMLILGIPYAPMIGALIGVTALLPLVGAYVGTIVGAVIIMTVNPFKALVFVIFIIALQQVEGNLIYPRTVGAKMKLPPLWVLAAVVVGGNIGGPIGMLLGVPIMSAAYALIKEATEHREEALLKKQSAKESLAD